MRGSWWRAARRVLMVLALVAGGVASTHDPVSATSAVSWSGVVRTAEGTPVPGVYLQALDTAAGWRSETSVAADGSFTLNVVPGTFTILLSVSDPTLLPATLPDYFFLSLPHTLNGTTSDISLPATTTLTIHVQDATGNPIENSRILYDDQIRADDDPTWTESQYIVYGLYAHNTQVTTDSNGNYTTPIWPTTSISYTNGPRIRADYAIGNLTAYAYLPAPTAVTNTITIELDIDTPVSWSGVVRTAEGTPVPGVYLQALDTAAGWRSETSVAADGSFTLNVVPGTFTILLSVSDPTLLPATLPDYFFLSLPHTLNGTTSDISLPATTTLTIHVQDATGNPIENSRILYDDQIRADDDPTWTESQYIVYGLYAHNTQVTTDSNGNYTTPIWPTTSISYTNGPRIRADYAIGNLTAYAYLPAPTAVTNTITIELDIDTPVSWSGVVRTAEGTPVPGVYLQALDTAAGWRSETSVAADGSFTLNVVPGTFTILLSVSDPTLLPATLPDYFFLSLPHTLNGTTSDISLPATTTLTIHVQDATGNPIENSRILYDDQIRADDDPTWTESQYIVYGLYAHNTQVTTDSNGNYTTPIWPTTSISYTNGPRIRADYAIGNLTAYAYLPAPTAVTNTITIELDSFARLDSEGSVDGEFAVVTPDDTSLADVTNAPADPTDIPSDVDPLTGSLDYTLTDIEPGSTQTVTLILPDGSDPTGVGMILDGEFVDLTDPSIDLATIDGDTITVEMQDGGPLDADGLANGVIVDPVIPFAPAAGGSATFKALPTPKRLVDTRAGQIGEIEKPGGSVGSDVTAKLVANVPTRWVVTNQAGIPANVAGLAVNLTAIAPPSGGNLSIYPCSSVGAARPSTSNINYLAGKTLANSAIVAPAANGGLCAISTNSVHIVLDVSGYLPSSSTFTALPSPKRLVDTRAAQVGEIEKPGGSVGTDVVTKLVANVPTRWVVTNQAGIPATVAGLAVNLTAIAPPSGGNLRIYPCTSAASTPPGTSNINYLTNVTLANSAIVAPAANGGICVLSTNSLHVILDTSGYYTTTSNFHALATPKRLVDTRAAQVGEIEKPGGSVGSDVVTQLVANVPTRWVVTNHAGIPASITALTVNLTAIAPPSGGNLRIYPCTSVASTPPATSNINYIPGRTLANSAIVAPAANGGLCALSSNNLHIILDTSGYLD